LERGNRTLRRRKTITTTGVDCCRKMSRNNVDYGAAWRLFSLLGICAIAVSQAQFGSVYVYKHNLGYLLTKVKAPHVATAKAKLIYNFKLSHQLFPVYFEPINCTGLSSRRGSSESTCRHLIPLLKTYQSTKIRILEYLKAQIERIYEILCPRLVAVFSVVV